MSDDGRRHHYFDLSEASPADHLLLMAIKQGHVPPTCLLGGHVVMGLNMAGQDPCADCNGPREKCKGRPQQKSERDSIDAMMRDHDQHKELYPKTLIEKPTNTSSEVRAQQRGILVFGLRRLAEEAREERAKRKE